MFTRLVHFPYRSLYSIRHPYCPLLSLKLFLSLPSRRHCRAKKRTVPISLPYILYSSLTLTRLAVARHGYQFQVCLFSRHSLPSASNIQSKNPTISYYHPPYQQLILSAFMQSWVFCYGTYTNSWTRFLRVSHHFSNSSFIMI